MDAILEQKLTRLKNYRTRYELVAVKGDESFLVLYVESRSRAGLVRAVQQRRDALVSLFGSTEIYLEAKGVVVTCGEWIVKFSGRTQREAFCAGELSFAEVA